MALTRAVLAACSLAALAVTVHAQAEGTTWPYIINEDTWPGTCGEARNARFQAFPDAGCDELPPRTDVPGCDVIQACKKSEGGYSGRGYTGRVQCDNCECDCTSADVRADGRVTTGDTEVQADQRALFGSCSQQGCVQQGTAPFAPADAALAAQYPEMYNCNLYSEAPAAGSLPAACQICVCRARTFKAAMTEGEPGPSPTAPLPAPAPPTEETDNSGGEGVPAGGDAQQPDVEMEPPAPVSPPATPPTPSPPTPAAGLQCGGGKCRARWDQCGGRGFETVSPCCQGDVCVTKNAFYSQCRPADKQVPAGWNGTVTECGP